MILVVGEAPNRTSDPAAPFGEGRGRARLERLVGPLGSFTVVNLLRTWPGASGKGSRFPQNAARRAAEALPLSDVEALVLVGLRVTRAFGVERARLLDRCLVRGRPALVVPHPSGVSTWWNDEGRVALGTRIARQFIQQHGRKS